MAAQDALSRSRTIPFRPSLLALASILVLAPGRDAAAHPGQWSSSNQRSHIQVHMALVRGDGTNYHSRILTWDGRGTDGGPGEEIGWSRGSEVCGTDAWSSFTFGLGTWSPGAKIFCDGHTHLATGELLSAGGDDVFTHFWPYE